MVCVKKLDSTDSDDERGAAAMRQPKHSGAVSPMPPMPQKIMGGLPSYLAIGTFALSGFAFLVLRQPALGSPTWWIGLGLGLLGGTLALVDWWRLTRGATFPVSLVTDLVAIGLIWARPEGVIGPILLVLATLMIGTFFSRLAVALHLLLTALAVGGLLWRGEDLAGVTYLTMTLAGVVWFVRILYRSTWEQAIQTNHLQRLLELLPVLKAHGVEEVVRAAVRHTVKATASDTGIVLLLDEADQHLRVHYIHNEKDPSPDEERAMRDMAVPIGHGLTGWVAQHAQSIITGDAARDPRALQVPGTEVIDESIMVIPLITNGRLYGVLRLDRQGLNQYRLEDFHLLELMAAHVSDAISRAQMEERMARRDALTGVYNRHYLNEWSERLSPERSDISLLMIDCRGFKLINDRWGHLEGDRVLRECARIISESVRARDLVVRYGGDEFLVVLEETGAQEAGAIAERLRHKVCDWNAHQPVDSPQLCLDIGIETAPQSQWQSLLGRADMRMYASKRGA